MLAPLARGRSAVPRSPLARRLAVRVRPARAGRADRPGHEQRRGRPAPPAAAGGATGPGRHRRGDSAPPAGLRRRDAANRDRDGAVHHHTGSARGHHGVHPGGDPHQRVRQRTGRPGDPATGRRYLGQRPCTSNSSRPA